MAQIDLMRKFDVPQEMPQSKGNMALQLVLKSGFTSKMHHCKTEANLGRRWPTHEATAREGESMV